MRILIPALDFPPVESEISLLTLQTARALSGQGHEVVVIAPATPDSEWHDTAEAYPVRRFPVHDTPGSRLLSLVRASWPHLRDADLVLAIGGVGSGAIGRAGRMLYGRPYITMTCGDEFVRFKSNWLARQAVLHICKHGIETIALSSYTEAQLADFGLARGRVRILLPGAHLPDPVPAEAITAVRHRFDLDATPFILAVGRFVPRNGHIVLVEAVAVLQERGVYVHAVLVGCGPERGACQHKAAALGIEGSIHCPGDVSDESLRALYQDCTCFALPTGEDATGCADGFGLAFAEAHAYGKPVVAGRSGGAADIVRHEETGMLVPPNSPGKLADALQRILGDPALAEALGNAGKRRVVEELNWDAFARGLLQRL